MGLYLSKDGVSKIWTKAKSTFQAKGNYVTTDTAQTISGIKTYNAPTNVNGSEQTTTKFKTSNGGAIIFGKEGPNSGTMIRLDQKDGTCRLRFRSSATAGAMVWEQPEQGARLYIDLGKDGADKHRIQFPSSAGTLALKSQIPDAYTKTEVDNKLSGKDNVGHTHAIATTNKDGFMSSTQVRALNNLANSLYHYYGGTYGDATNIDSPNGTYSMQIGDSGFTIDDGPPDSNPNNILQINANVFTYNGYKVLTSNDSGYLTKAESVIDYGDTTNTIKIGYRGNGLTASQILYIAGYAAGDNDNEHKIKDISKDVLKSWLGYSEVSTGVWSPGSTWTGTSGYVWIIFPYDVSANTFNFTYGSGDRTGYGFAILQGEGCIRYFQSTTQLTRYSTSRITFSTQMRYIKFKM